MDARRIAEEHIVERYLADQLDADEAARFEDYYGRNPEMVREIERTLRLREGLAVLNERGELDRIVRASPFWMRAIALAAGLAVLLIGVWWFNHTPAAPIAGTLAALKQNGTTPLRIASSYLLLKTRGSSGVLNIPFPEERGAIELRMIPSSRPENGRFRVRLGRPASGGTVTAVGEAQAVARPEDGVVMAYLDSARLTRGRYVIELAPADETSAGITDRFVIELR